MMTKTTKQLIDEWDDLKDKINAMAEALNEAVEIISEKDSIDRQALGSYYEKQNPLAAQWLKKHGFEK